MGYHLNFNLIWRYSTNSGWGLVLSLELAILSIAIGCVIGLALAVALCLGRPACVRGLVAAYVEFIRNVPLILLVYLVFYGMPTVVDFAYRRHDLVRRHAVGLCRRLSGRSVPRRASTPCRAALLDAGKAIGLTPWQRLVHVRLPTMLRIALPRPVEHLRVAVQGHLGRLGDRGAGADLRRELDQLQHVPHRRGLSRGHRPCIWSPATPSCSACARSSAATRSVR